MLRTILVGSFLLSLVGPLAPQEAPPSTIKKDGMQVQVNVMNVCNPSDDEQKGIAAALQRLPLKPRFAPDFEVARGRTTFPDAPISTWARIRREFQPDFPFASVQYSVSLDEKALIETLVFRVRDAKDLLSVTLEDRMSTVTAPAAALATDTPASRVKIERFGRNSLGLARCEQADQAAYQPLFDTASKVLAQYRSLLGARATIPAELARAAAGTKPPPPRRSMAVRKHDR
ncbi:MAG TPA: hypothetical protein VMS96_03420 [Terriglobales bacterium]|nr:hypothetical protein [Terriglobales bacterium]